MKVCEIVFKSFNNKDFLLDDVFVYENNNIKIDNVFSEVSFYDSNYNKVFYIYFNDIEELVNNLFKLKMKNKDVDMYGIEYFLKIEGIDVYKYKMELLL